MRSISAEDLSRRNANGIFHTRRAPWSVPKPAMALQSPDLPLVIEALQTLAPPLSGWAAIEVCEKCDDLFDVEKAAIAAAAPLRVRTFASGRRAARLALAAAGCIDAGAVLTQADGAPIPPPGWLLTISHTDQIAVALAAPVGAARGLGVDIEQIGRMDLGLRRHILGPFDHLPDAAGLTELTAMFSLKESLFKALSRIDRQGVGAAGVVWNDTLEGPRIATAHQARPGWRRVGAHVLSLCVIEHEPPPPTLRQR